MHRLFRVFALTFALIFAPGALSWLSPGVRAQPLPDRRTMTGTVVDQDGKPLAKAVVSIRRQEDTGPYAFWSADTSTDDNGVFVFPDAELGAYYLNVQMDGFAQVLNQVVNRRADTPPVQSRMEQLATARLRILKVDGSPLLNAPIYARLRADGIAGPNYVSLVTDDHGVAPAGGLTPATYSVYVVAPGQGFARLFGLVVHHNSGADPTLLQLQPGGSLKLTLTALATPDVPALGVGGAQLQLIPATPQDTAALLGPINDPGENLALISAAGDETVLTTREGDGSITLNDLPPASYTARLLLPGEPFIPNRNVVITPGTTTTLNWQPPEVDGVPLKLQLHTGAGAPLVSRDCNVRILPMGPIQPTVPGAPLTGGPTAAPVWFGFNGARHGVSDEGGNLTVFPLHPGKYRLWVSLRTPVDSAATTVDADVTATGSTATVTVPGA